MTKLHNLAALATSVLMAGAGAAAATAPAHASEPAPEPNVINVQRAAFVTPTGNMSCVMDDEGVTCDATKHDWPNLPVQCETGEGGNLVRLTDRPRPSCIGDPLRLRAALPDSINGDNSLTDYYATAGPARHDVHFAEDSHTYAGLNYNTKLVSRDFEVTLEPTGVTARNIHTGHSFTMSQQQVTMA